ncbi:hypothetical protein [Streptomyces sp. NPDC017448]|uniref:hypothetical protein n=1 Tax=Streptomyces sp. NPDC017448 TaxID=3364996 RepID=UPI0037A3B725
MSSPSLTGKAAASLLGLLVGTAAGFLLTETVAAFFHPVLNRTLDGDGPGVLPAFFVAVPLICGVLGAVIGARRAGGSSTHHHSKGW